MMRPVGGSLSSYGRCGCNVEWLKSRTYLLLSATYLFHPMVVIVGMQEARLHS